MHCVCSPIAPAAASPSCAALVNIWCLNKPCNCCRVSEWCSSAPAGSAPCWPSWQRRVTGYPEHSSGWEEVSQCDPAEYVAVWLIPQAALTRWSPSGGTAGTCPAGARAVCLGRVWEEAGAACSLLMDTWAVGRAVVSLPRCPCLVLVAVCGSAGGGTVMGHTQVLALSSSPFPTWASPELLCAVQMPLGHHHSQSYTRVLWGSRNAGLCLLVFCQCHFNTLSKKNTCLLYWVAYAGLKLSSYYLHGTYLFYLVDFKHQQVLKVFIKHPFIVLKGLLEKHKEIFPFWWIPEEVLELLKPWIRHSLWCYNEFG